MNGRSGTPGPGPMTYSQSSPLPANVALVRSPATMSMSMGSMAGGGVPVPVYPTPPGSTGSHQGHGWGVAPTPVHVPANIAQSPQMSPTMSAFVQGSVVPRSIADPAVNVPKSASVTSLARRGGLLARLRDLRLGGGSHAQDNGQGQGHAHPHSGSGSHSHSHGHGRSHGHSHRSGSHRTGSSMSSSLPSSSGRGRTSERAGRGSAREEAGEWRRRDRERKVESGRTQPNAPRPDQRRAHSADSDASISSASTYYVIPQKGQKVRVIVSSRLSFILYYN